MRRAPAFPLILLACCLTLTLACNDPARPGGKHGSPINPSLLCACSPTHITKDDWRIELKNGPLPQLQPEQTSVATILAWPEGPEPGARTARSGRELKMYQIGKAFMQTAFLRKSDCDLHIEISENADKNAPRMIVETPGTQAYCGARTDLSSALKRRGFTLTDLNQELSPPLPVQVEGVAFRDQSHPVWFARGSAKVQTLWEIHPAIVKLLLLNPD